ncbi:type 4a pilus biogenesis protein PilO [Pseudoalteromonas sp. SSDWG2]|uniref:type 4a pilus biogenesis protein PilO n=1 Tax=Pseudoalteromonas sp. SSDWG2 TaxID=3139391 RepID=UPI003BAB5939
MSTDLKALTDIDWSDLTLDNIGEWPSLVKSLVFIFVFIIILGLSYKFLVEDKIGVYETTLNKETELRDSYRVKYAKASRLEIYKQQMQEMEEKFSQLLKKLPTSNETPGLLDDLSYVGTTSGLTFVKIGWLPEVKKEFYTELPIKIEVEGSYHEFGEFVGKVAQLPRIISLHDFEIQATGDDQLVFSVIAKTYRYEGDE